MATETTVVYGTSKTLEANGASIINNNVDQANDANYSPSTDGADYPDAEFVLSITFATAPTENSTIVLLVRPVNIDGTSDSEVPENGATTFKGQYVGTFVLNNVTTTQYARLIAYDVPPTGDYFIWNNNTGQTISAGWTLKVRPRTYKPAP